MRPIIKWTVWQRRWSIMWWCIGVTAFIVLNMVFYPSFKDQAAELQKSFTNIPDTAVQLIGGSTDFFSPVGFMNSQIYFLMLPLLLGILAISLGSSLVAREEQSRTAEALLSRPLSRSAFLLGKALAGFITLAIITLVSLGDILVIAKIVHLEMPTLNLVVVTGVCFLLALSFGAIAFVLAAIGRTRGGSLGIAAAFALGGYIISSLAGTVKWLKGPSYIFPFHYYHSEAILRGTFAWMPVLAIVAFTFVAAILSWATFRRRDLL